MPVCVGPGIPRKALIRGEKTAVLALAAARGGDPLELALVNRVRRDFLTLAPIARLRGEQGLGEVIDLLRGS